jgi:hypothetical protein
MRSLLIFFAALMLAPAAQAQQRTLDVPATARWQHARSGVIVPVAIDGLPRREIVEIMPGELDVGVNYDDGTTRISIFLFRPALFDVGIWFDRADWAIRQNPVWGNVTPSRPAPLTFAHGSATTASAMRQSYAASGQYRATATAIVPTGRWLVKVRASVRNGTVEEVDARLSAALAALRLDATRHGGVAARPILPCVTPVRWRNARQQPRTMDDALMGALLGALAGRMRQRLAVERTQRWLPVPPPSCRRSPTRRCAVTCPTMPVTRSIAVQRRPIAMRWWLAIRGRRHRSARR